MCLKLVHSQHLCFMLCMPENGLWRTISSTLDFCTRTSTTRTCGDGLVSLYIFTSVTYQPRWSHMYLSQHVQGSSKPIIVCPEHYGQISVMRKCSCCGCTRTHVRTQHFRVVVTPSAMCHSVSCVYVDFAEFEPRLQNARH